MTMELLAEIKQGARVNCIVAKVFESVCYEGCLELHTISGNPTMILLPILMSVKVTFRLRCGALMMSAFQGQKGFEVRVYVHLQPHPPVTPRLNQRLPATLKPLWQYVCAASAPSGGQCPL